MSAADPVTGHEAETHSQKEIITNNVKPKYESLNILTKELPEMHKIVSAASVEKSFSNTRVRHMKTEHIH